MNNLNMVYPLHPFEAPNKQSLCYWENFLTEDDINTILARPEWIQSNEALVGDGNEGVVDKKRRTTNVSWMDVDDKNKHIWQKITNTIWSANRQFFHYDLTGCYEAAQLGCYTSEESGHYGWHTDAFDSSTAVPRKLSMSLILSDPSEFEGGKLQVKHGDDKIKELEQVKGRAWFFPSWMLHRVTPVTKGVRRSLVLWAGGPAFK